MIPAHDQARKDARLHRGHTLRVYFWLHERLDTVEFRPIKLTSVMHGCAIEKGTASEVMNRLIGLGYLASRASQGRGREYRLIYSVPVLG